MLWGWWHPGPTLGFDELRAGNTISGIFSEVFAYSP
jgi:hypothetical protein